MTEPRATIPILAERIERVDDKVTGMRTDFDAKFARVYALLGAILVSVIAGIVVALVTR